MRQIGTVPDGQAARRFEGYLLTRGIKGRVEEDSDGWAVWIFDEDDVEPAKKELEQFVNDPDNPVYKEAAGAAAGVRRRERREDQKTRRNYVDVRRKWAQRAASRRPVTTALIAGSVIATLLASDFGNLFRLGEKIEPVWTWLAIAPLYEEGWYPGRGLQAVWRHGQVWRLVTPILLHLSLLHILFNMLWLGDLGGAIESRQGSLRFLLIVLAIATISNLAQYWYKGPFFGGMSGVVFGLFGYIWMKSRFDAGSGFFMPPQIVFWMIVWLVVCYTGAVGPIANAAHTAGLVTGIVLGYAPKLGRDLRRKLGSS